MSREEDPDKGFAQFEHFLDEWSRRDFLKRTGGAAAYLAFLAGGAEWLAAATRKAHRLGCNPGGEVASMEIEPDHPMLTHYQFGVLMDRATLERLDRTTDGT